MLLAPILHDLPASNLSCTVLGPSSHEHLTYATANFQTCKVDSLFDRAQPAAHELERAAGDRPRRFARSTLLSSENSAFMPAAGGPAVAACFGASLIRLPRPPAGMGGGGAGPPRFAAAGAEAGSGFAAPGQPKRWRKAAFTAQDICIWQGQTPGDPCAFSSGGPHRASWALQTGHTLLRGAHQLSPGSRCGWEAFAQLPQQCLQCCARHRPSRGHTAAVALAHMVRLQWVPSGCAEHSPEEV